MIPRNVLLIDDHPCLLHFLHCSLKDRWPGCLVDTAQSSRHARFLLKSNHYDLVLTDHDLRDGSGLEIVEMAQQLLPSSPIILMTARPTTVLEQYVAQETCGISILLRKPFDLQQLFLTLESFEQPLAGSAHQ